MLFSGIKFLFMRHNKCPEIVESDPGMPDRKVTILVADDQVDFRRLFSLLMEEEGYNVLTAASVEEVFTVFEERRKKNLFPIDLGIFDNRMPNPRDGLDELTLRIAKIPESLRPVRKIITVTGSPEDITAEDKRIYQENGWKIVTKISGYIDSANDKLVKAVKESLGDLPEAA